MLKYKKKLKVAKKKKQKNKAQEMLHRDGKNKNRKCNSIIN